MYGPKKWDIEFAGILAEDGAISSGKDAIFVNRNNSLQFYIKVISKLSDTVGRQIKDVCCFTEELESWGFYDDTTLFEHERIEVLRDYLSRYVLFFKVEQKKPAGGMEYHIAKDLHVVKMSENLSPQTSLQKIPVFSEETTQRTKEIFEQQLQSQKYIGDNKQISKDDENVPELILWRDQPDGQGYTVYGLFDKYESAHGGFRFHPALGKVHLLDLQMEYLMESYVRDQVLFIDEGLWNQLKSALVEHGDFIKELQKSESIVEKTANPKPIEHIPLKDNSTIPKEIEFIKIFEHECQRLGLYYENKDLYNFHTAMKTGNLVILAGMSGTGKSKLVQCYANALKLSKEQMLFIPVRPFWQDDADVIGYLDTVHNLYRPGDSGLVNILTRADEYADDLHIICFDEMNLARVEHYLSQFLSVLEMEENKRVLRLYNEEFSTRVYNQNIFPTTLRIGSNVIFVGTVNLDESTYQFSDKVLDRANVITLKMKPYSEVLTMEEKRKQETNSAKGLKENTITYDEYHSFRRKEREILLSEQESTFLWNLHTELQKCSRNLGIGWRIIRQISNFLNNLPSPSPLSREEAFDIQVVQRILTKVRGSDEQFMELLGRYNVDSKQVEQSKFMELLSEMPTSYVFEHTRKLIQEKAKELRLYGHTV